MSKKSIYTFQSKIELLDPKSLTSNEKNPRLMSRKDFNRLKANLKKNPNMLMIRPVVYENVGKKRKVIAGNYRHKGVLELKWSEIPSINATKLTPKERENFILWDNETPGRWDLEALGTWKDLHGIDIPSKEKHKFTDENAEMPIVPKFDEKYYAVLIVVESEMDFANICTLLDLNRSKDYKTKTIKQTQVIGFSDFIKKVDEWKKSK